MDLSGEESCQRLVVEVGSVNDWQRAERAVVCLRQPMQQQAEAALSWRRWLHYRTLHEAQRVMGTDDSLVKWLTKQYRMIDAQRESWKQKERTRPDE